MGMEQRVTFGGGADPSWPVLRDYLGAYGYPVQMRMIDGELALPDEEPPEAWRELRLGTPGGMITLRRDAGGITLVTWGNADEAMRQAWNALTFAVAAVGGGKVVTPTGEVSAEEFWKASELPAVLKAHGG